MAVHQFLSPEWIDAALEIHEEMKGRIDEPDEHVRMNVVVTDAPFTEDQVTGHIDTTAGSSVPQHGLLDDPDLTIFVPYAVAKDLFVGQQFESVMIAFMSGEIEISGDVTLLMALQDVEPTAEQQALAEEVVQRLTAITSDE